MNGFYSIGGGEFTWFCVVKWQARIVAGPVARISRAKKTRGKWQRTKGENTGYLIGLH